MFSKHKKKISNEWIVDVNNSITSKTAILGKSIVFGTQNGEVICINQEGKIHWTYNAAPHLTEKEALFVDNEEANSIFCTPRIHENNIYVGTESGELHCINNEGKQLWKQLLDGGIRATPTITSIDGELKIVVGTIDGSIYFLNLQGKILKIIKIRSPISTNVHLVNGNIIVGCNDGKIIACNQKGLHLWTYQTQAKITANIIQAELFSDEETNLLIGSQDNFLYVLTLDGELKWKFQTQGAIVSAPLAIHLSSNESKDIMIGSCDNSIYCISAHGEKLWSYETDFWVTASPIVVDNDGNYRICIGSYDQKFYVLDGDSDFNLSFMPGLAGIINQTGYTCATTSRDVGESKAKKICEQAVEGHITSCTNIPHTQRVIVTTNQGKMYEFSLS